MGSFEEKNGQITFEYDSAASQLLSLSMPQTTRHHRNKAANAFLWGLLPDNAEALRAMAAEAGTSANSVFGLLSYHGRDVAGALQLLPPGENPSDAVKKSVHSVSERLSEEQIETLLRQTLDRYNGRANTRLGESGFKFSIAGAQPKIALTADENECFLPPSKDFATTHIIKPNDPSSTSFVDEMDKLEVMCLAAANEIGLPAAEAYLWEAPSGDMTAIVSQRYDRAMNADGTIDRLHQEDMCQALSVMPEKKYQHEYGGPGLAEINRLLKSRLMSEYSQVNIDFFKAVVFNVGIVGTDAHAKNYSLMIGSEGVTIAPLYDSISAAAHVIDSQKVSFPMKINDTYDMASITPTGLVAAGTKIGIDRDQAETAVNHILSSIPDAIASVATEMREEDLGERVLEGLQKFSPVRYIE